MGRHTMTNLLTTEGRQFVDWTADYRMYSRERIACKNVFGQIRKEVYALNDRRPLITALDDSLLPKTGKKIPGVKFARDPMGPPFQVNFIRGQRVIQMSAPTSRGRRPGQDDTGDVRRRLYPGQTQTECICGSMGEL